MALLGEILLENKMVTPQNLGMALMEQKRTGELMGNVMLRLGIVSRNDLTKAIAIASDIPFIDLKQTFIDPVAFKEIDKATARKFKLMPFAAEGRVLRVAMDNPNDIKAVDFLRRHTGKTIEIFAAGLEGINEAIELHYEVGATLDQDIDKNIQAAMRGGLAVGEVIAPVVRLVDLFLTKAIRDHATDLHITPQDMASRVSFRIDGILQSGVVLPKLLHVPLVNRVKVISGMDIAESRLPQEGNLRYEFFERRVDIRTSTSPCSQGENLVLRILDKASVVLGLDYIGLSAEDRKMVEKICNRPHGIVLAAGPTGSGKTTTLYSMLRQINALEKNILTIEDPIEYNLPLIKQTQVNEQAGLTFSEAIRHFLRQDPDVILVGEIRDLETAKIAFQAAMTGHLVLSTIHTNDSTSTIPRLLDLGVEAYLIPSSLRAVIAQRLLRRVCDSCGEEYVPKAAELSPYSLEVWAQENQVLKRGVGCDNCAGTGYRGRTGIFEILEITQAISAMITSRASSDQLMVEACRAGMRTMQEEGLEKVKLGITTLEEVFRLT